MVMLRMSAVAAATSPSVAQRRMPPALPRPPVFTCALTTTGSPSSPAAACASAGENARREGRTLRPAPANRLLPLCSSKSTGLRLGGEAAAEPEGLDVELAEALRHAADDGRLGRLGRHHASDLHQRADGDDVGDHGLLEVLGGGLRERDAAQVAALQAVVGLDEPGVVHEQAAGARVLGVLLVGRLREAEAHIGRIYLWVVDLVVGDDGLGLRGAAARRRPVALGLHDVLAQGGGRLGDDRRRQQDALAARAGEADLDARRVAVRLSHGGPPVPAPARGRARRRTRRARCDAAGPRGTARAGARRPPRTCWLARRAPSGLSLIHISEPTRRTPTSYAVF